MLSTISFVIHNNPMGSSEAKTRKISPPATTLGADSHTIPNTGGTL
jgi:hypothetical protein